MKDGELWYEYYTRVSEDSKTWGGSMHYRRGVHASLSDIRGTTDLVVTVWHTHL